MNDHRININIGADANVGDINVVIGQLGKLDAAVDKVDGKTANVSAEAEVAKAETKLKGLGQLADSIEDEIVINAEANTAEAMSNLKFLQREANSLHNKIYRMELQAKTDEAKAAFSDMRAELRDIQETATIAIAGNTSDVDAKITDVKKEMNNLEGLKATMDLKADTADFNREAKLVNSQLDSIDRRIVKAIVTADTADAVAKWTALRATLRDQRVEIKVDVDRGSIAAILSATSALGKLKEAGIGFVDSLPTLVGGVAKARAGVIALATAVGAMLLPGLGAAVGALGIVAGAAASAAGGFGLLFAAFSPTIKAFKEMEEGTEAAKAAMEAVETASAGVEDAQTSLADATRNGAKAVKDAKEAYKDSLEAVKKARAGVADAERDAAESIRDAQDAYKDSLDSVADARAELVKVERDGARAIKEAIAGVADARANLAQTERDGAAQIKDALEAVGDARRQAAADTRSANAAITDAEQGLDDARETLTDSTEDLEDAQRDLNNAMRQEPLNQKEATLDLADARDRATDAQRDYNDAVKKYGKNSEEATDAQRDLQRANLELQRTEQDVADIRKNGSKQLQDAKENAKSAGEAQKNASDEVKKGEQEVSRARRDAARVAKEGARGIRDAQQGVTKAQKDAAAATKEAQRGVTEAVRGVKSAQQDAAQATKEAQRGVRDALEDSADAQKDVVKAQKDGARSIKEAQAGVQDALKDSRDAQKNVAAVQKQSAREVADAQKQVADALKELADAEKKADAEAVKLSRSQKVLWNELNRTKKEAGDAFKPANDSLNYFGRDVLRVAQKLLPGLGREAKESGDGLRSAFKGVIDDTTNREIQSYKKVLDSFSPIVASLTRSFGSFGQGMINVWRQAIPFIMRFVEGIEDLMDRFKAYTNTAKGQKEINEFLKGAEIIGSALWKAIGKVADAFYDVTRNRDAMESLGGFVVALATGIGRVIRFLGFWVEGWGDVTQMIGGTIRVLNEFGRLIAAVVLRDGKKAEDAMNGIADAFRFIGKALWDLIKDMPGMDAIVGFAKKALEYLRGPFIDGIKKWGPEILQWMLNPFGKLYEKVIGNSIIPDLRRDVVRVFGDMGADLRDSISKTVDDVLGKFGDMATGARDRMEDARKWATGKAKDAKEGVVGWFKDMADGSEQQHTNLRDDSKAKMESTRKTGTTKMGTFKEDVIAHFSGMKKKSIDEHMEAFKKGGISKSEATKAGMTPPMYEMATKNRGYLSSLLDGMQKVNENADLGLPAIKGFAAQAAATGDGGNDGSGTNDHFGVRAAGGLIEPLRGPVSYLVGDEGQREYVINPSRDDNVKHLRDAAGEMGYEVRRKEEAPDWLTNPPLYKMPNLISPFTNVGSGEGLGPEMHTYTPEMQSWVNRLENQFSGIYTNTYSNHPMGFEQPYYRERSVDAWGGGGRGAPIGTGTGDQVAKYTIDELGSNLNWLIWNGRMLSASGWGPDTSGFSHHDHVHTTAFADKHANVGGGAGFSGSGIDISDEIEKYIPKPWEAGPTSPYNLADKSGIAGKARSKIIEVLEAKAAEMTGGSGGPGTGFSGGGDAEKNRQLGQEMNAAMGWGQHWNALDQLWTQESQWSHTADNPSSSAYGIPQALTDLHNLPSGYGPPGGDPKVQIDWGLGYIKGRYGNPGEAWQFHQANNHYGEGGIVTKDQIARVGENGPEMFLPLHDRDSVRRFVDNLSDWHQQQQAKTDSYQVRNQVRQQHDVDVVSQTVRSRERDSGGNGAMLRELRNLGGKIERSTAKRVDAKLENIEELADALLIGANALQHGPAGESAFEKHQQKALQRILSKRGK